MAVAHAPPIPNILSVSVGKSLAPTVRSREVWP